MGNSPSKNDPLPNTSSNHGSSMSDSLLGTNEDLDPDERSSALRSSSSNFNSKYNQSSAIDIAPGKYPSNNLTPNFDNVVSPVGHSRGLNGPTSPSPKRHASSRAGKIRGSRSHPKRNLSLDFEIDANMATLLTTSHNSSSTGSGNSPISMASGSDVVPGIDVDVGADVNATGISVPDGSRHKFNHEYGSSFESELSQVFTTTDGKDADLLLSLGSMSTSPKGSGLKPAEIESDTIVGNLDPISESLESTPKPEKQPVAVDTISKSDLKMDTINKKMSDISISSSSSSESPPSSATNFSTTSKDTASRAVPYADGNTTKNAFPVNIDGIIEKLIQIGHHKSSKNPTKSRRFRDKLPFSNDELKFILNKSRSIFLDQPTLLRLSPPVNIVGDLHGQFLDLVRIFDTCGYPPYSNYLFLGDYVDRGYKSLETMLLLLCYKIKYPENFFMLRGNHESANITKIYGFYDECKRRLPSITGNHKVWKSFVDVFNTLPIAATINDKIFCIHGGLSPDLHELRQIENIRRPTDVPDKGLLADLLWSDPDPNVKSFSLTHWPKNDRGVSYCFGKKHVDYFCQRFNFDLIVRGHMVVEDGYEFFNKRKLVTVFSAPNYCGEFNNFGSVMIVDKTLCCSFELIKPL